MGTLERNYLQLLPLYGFFCIEQVAQKRIVDNSGEIEIRMYESGGGLKKGREREQTLGFFKVDGLLLYKTCDKKCASLTLSEKKTNQHKSSFKAFGIFFGCFFHGCPLFYPDRSETNKKRNTITMNALQAITVLNRMS